jgi:dihydrofolate reductase
MRLVVVEFLTLDGVMQGLGSPDEDRDGGFPYGGWGAAYQSPDQLEAAAAGLASTTGYLLGRRTYEKMAAFWPGQPDANPLAAHLNATPKYVATRASTPLAWRNSHRLDGELVAAVTDLKSNGEGDLVVLGSGVLVEQLSAEDLVDEYQLFLHPLLLGTGKRLFRALDRPRRLRLLSATPTSTGVLMLRYAVVDPPAGGQARGSRAAFSR